MRVTPGGWASSDASGLCADAAKRGSIDAARPGRSTAPWRTDLSRSRRGSLSGCGSLRGISGVALACLPATRTPTNGLLDGSSGQLGNSSGNSVLVLSEVCLALRWQTKDPLDPTSQRFFLLSFAAHLGPFFLRTLGIGFYTQLHN